MLDEYTRLLVNNMVANYRKTLCGKIDEELWKIVQILSNISSGYISHTDEILVFKFHRYAGIVAYTYGRMHYAADKVLPVAANMVPCGADSLSKLLSENFVVRDGSYYFPFTQVKLKLGEAEKSMLEAYACKHGFRE